MKRFIRFAIAIGISMMLALCSAAVTHTFQPTVKSDLSAAFFFETTPTPEQANISRVGSTDGIVVMGFIIVAIVILPILIRRKDWKETR